MDRINEEIAHQQERIQNFREQRLEIKKHGMALPIEPLLWSQKARIEALAEHTPWIESLQRQSIRLETEIDQTSQATNIEFQTQRRASDYLCSNGMHLISLYKNTT